MVNMDSKSIMDDEYESQYYKNMNTSYFLYSLRSIVDSSIQEHKEAEEKLVKDELLQVSPNNETLLAIVNENYKGMQESFIAEVQGPLDKLKPISRAFFKIPNNIVLDEDRYNELSKNDIHALKLEEAQLKLQLLQQKIYNIIMNKEISVMVSLKPIKETLAISIKVMEKRQKNISEQKHIIKELIIYNNKINSIYFKSRRSKIHNINFKHF